MSNQIQNLGDYNKVRIGLQKAGGSREKLYQSIGKAEVEKAISVWKEKTLLVAALGGVIGMIVGIRYCRKNEVKESEAQNSCIKKFQEVIEEEVLNSSSYKAKNHKEIGLVCERRNEITEEEKKLLFKLNKGNFDGMVGDRVVTVRGSAVFVMIQNGMPICYERGPAINFFNGKERERQEGKLFVLKKWETNSEKIEFLRSLGWLINDKEAKKYSKKWNSESEEEK